MRTAFTNATIWTAVDDPIEGATLLVADGRIVDVGTEVDVDGAEVVDCTGKVITPGFIECHSHAGVSGEGVWGDMDINEMSESIAPHVRMLDAIHPEDLGFLDARRGGITTMGITHGSALAIGGQVAATKTAGSVADEMVIREPAGMKMALGENPKRVGETGKRAPQTRMGTAYLARKAFTEAQEYRRDWEHHEALLAAQEAKPLDERTPLREPKRDLSLETLVRVLDGEFPVRNHSHRMDDMRTAIRLSEEFGYRLVIDHATEAHRMVDELVRREIPLVVGPIAGTRTKRELLNRTPATVGIMVEAGARVAITTDAPVNAIWMLRDLVIFCIREGLAEEKALATVTTVPAQILGIDDRVGSLEPGKDADFVVFGGDPWDARNKPEQTWVDGVLAHEGAGPYLP